MEEKASTSRGTTWGEDEVKVLLEIWGDEKIQSEMDGAKRKHPLHEKIATKMKTKGYNRDADQIKTKIKNLKSTYRSIKDHNNKTGNDKKTSQFYDELDAILGHRPASTPPVILDACAGGLSALPEEAEEEDEFGKYSSPTVFGLPSEDEPTEASTPGDIPGGRGYELKLFYPIVLLVVQCK